MLVRVPETEADAGEDREVEFGAGSGVVAIDFRETSPAGSEKEMYGANRAGRYAAQVGGLAIGVPGELRGLEAGEHHSYSEAIAALSWDRAMVVEWREVVLTIAAHKLYGKLPWEEVVMPVAELARGWHVSRELARRLRIFGWVRRSATPRVHPVIAADTS